MDRISFPVLVKSQTVQKDGDKKFEKKSIRTVRSIHRSGSLKTHSSCSTWHAFASLLLAGVILLNMSWLLLKLFRCHLTSCIGLEDYIPSHKITHLSSVTISNDPLSVRYELDEETDKLYVEEKSTPSCESSAEKFTVGASSFTKAVKQVTEIHSGPHESDQKLQQKDFESEPHLLLMNHTLEIANYDDVPVDQDIATSAELLSGLRAKDFERYDSNEHSEFLEEFTEEPQAATGTGEELSEVNVGDAEIGIAALSADADLDTLDTHKHYEVENGSDTGAVISKIEMPNDGTGPVQSKAWKRSESSRHRHRDNTKDYPAQVKKDNVPESCDLYDGQWVYDDSYPLYSHANCPFIDEGFNCQANGRPDSGYTKWRWQPFGCNMPRFEAKSFLEVIRGKRLAFVGDSLGRNQWESLLCLLYQAIPNKQRVYEVNRKHITKKMGYMSFKFADYNCRIDFFRSPFLIAAARRPPNSPAYVKNALKLDTMDAFAKRWRTADILVFNSGHWWTDVKTLRAQTYFQIGSELKLKMNVDEAFQTGISTWASYLDANIDPARTQVFFRSFSPYHWTPAHSPSFSHSQNREKLWNSGGHCNRETEPFVNYNLIDNHFLPIAKVKVVEQVIASMSTPVTLLNATRLTEFRKDAHPSLWGFTNSTAGVQDCNHWCLPGVPDTWNELLYTSILMNKRRRGKHHNTTSTSPLIKI